MLRRIFLLIASVFVTAQSFGQYAWPSPEVEQLYKQAKDYLSRGGINQAVVQLQQAIQLAPEVPVLYRDLAQALTLQQKYSEAYKTVEPLIKDEKADELTYQIASNALLAQSEKKKAKNVIEKGLKRYPQSGILYHELSRIYELNADPEYALDALLQGIQVDPAYHMNYFEAARIYNNTGRPVWTILYGEIFCNLERQTSRSQDMRKMVFDAYRRIFTEPQSVTTPSYGERLNRGEEPTFEAAVMQTFNTLSPVMSDGVTTDNLVMLRTRFAMEWNTSFADKFPFSLFAYHEQLLREGEFDAYNQWMFGMAENPKLYETWTKFHTEAMPGFEQWIRTHPFKPLAADFHNTKDLRNLFDKKKKG